MKYLKLFNNTTDHEAFKNSSDFVKPNVSYIESEGHVEYVADKIEIIEYHFDIPMHLENEATGDIVPDTAGPSKLLNVCGTIEGDFSELYNKLRKLCLEYNIDGYCSVPKEDALAKTNITVNGIRLEALSTYSDESYDIEMNNFSFGYTNSMEGIIITPTSVRMEFKSVVFPNYPNWKEDETIEYHFEISMEEVEPDNLGDFNKLYGEKHENYSNIRNKLIAFITDNGKVVNGEYICDSNTFAGKVNITINEYNVVELYYSPSNNDFVLIVDAPTHSDGAYASLYDNSINFRHGIPE